MMMISSFHRWYFGGDGLSTVPIFSFFVLPVPLSFDDILLPVLFGVVRLLFDFSLRRVVFRL